jgi:hypothetical protein
LAGLSHDVNLWAIRSKFTNDEMSGRFAASGNEVNTGQHCAIRMRDSPARIPDQAVLYSTAAPARGGILPLLMRQDSYYGNRLRC